MKLKLMVAWIILLATVSLVSCTSPVAKVLIQKESTEVFIYERFSHEWKVGDRIFIYRDLRGQWIYDEYNLKSKGLENRNYNAVYACRWATIQEIYLLKESQSNNSPSTEKVENDKSTDIIIVSILLLIGVGFILIVILALNDLFKIKKKTISKH